MPVILPDHRLAYFFVPKVACTSLKSMFFEIENGRPFQPFTVSGVEKTVHAVYGHAFFDRVDTAALEGFTRIALVRDPVARIVSCYRNRIGAKNVLARPEEAGKLAGMGLSSAPSLSDFVARLRRYRKANRIIAHHSHPLSTHLGRDPAYFSRIYRFAELPEMAADICAHVGRAVALPHLQREGTGESVADLTAEEADRIRTLYAEDYEIFGDWL